MKCFAIITSRTCLSRSLLECWTCQRDVCAIVMPVTTVLLSLGRAPWRPIRIYHWACLMTWSMRRRKLNWRMEQHYSFIQTDWQRPWINSMKCSDWNEWWKRLWRRSLVRHWLSICKRRWRPLSKVQNRAMTWRCLPLDIIVLKTHIFWTRALCSIATSKKSVIWITS